MKVGRDKQDVTNNNIHARTPEVTSTLKPTENENTTQKTTILPFSSSFRQPTTATRYYQSTIGDVQTWGNIG